VLVGNDTNRIVEEATRILDGGPVTRKVPRFWDGKASERIVSVLKQIAARS
jgi:UDP-N-acetylglucosamine 2-epimerase